MAWALTITKASFLLVVTTSMVGLNTVTYAKISPKMVNSRDIAGKHRRRRRTPWALRIPLETQ